MGVVSGAFSHEIRAENMMLADGQVRPEGAEFRDPSGTGGGL